MSVYIVNDETISAIVNGFEIPWGITSDDIRRGGDKNESDYTN